jgi:hypothetical protein
VRNLKGIRGYVSHGSLGSGTGDEIRARHAFCLHVTGLKLLDDIVDADQDIDPRELVVGHVFCDDALQRNPCCRSRCVLLADFDDKWLPILRHVFDEPETEIYAPSNNGRRSQV